MMNSFCNFFEGGLSTSALSRFRMFIATCRILGISPLRLIRGSFAINGLGISGLMIFSMLEFFHA